MAKKKHKNLHTTAGLSAKKRTFAHRSNGCQHVATRQQSHTNMINRELIRLKVVQLTYAHYQNGDRMVDTAEKELFKSLAKAYDLYLLMLQLVVELGRMAERTYETAVSRANRLGLSEMPSSRFVDNRFITLLSNSEELQDAASAQKLSWTDDVDFVRRLYKRIQASDIYAKWMASADTPTFEAERDLWRRIYKNIIIADEELEQVLEDKSIYWNDDRFIIDTFVLKTINHIEPTMGRHQELLPEYRDEDDREFARRLFRASLLSADSYRNIIAQFLRGWDLSRVALMDLIVMQIAIAEMLTFPQIPLQVTINEYVNIAKVYSTPRSGAYVNGMLDSIARALIADGKLRKTLDTPARETPPSAETAATEA